MLRIKLIKKKKKTIHGSKFFLGINLWMQNFHLIFSQGQECEK